MNNKSEDKIKTKDTNKKTYTETLLSIIVLALIIAIFVIFFHKPNIVDFLEQIKTTYINSMLIILSSIIIFSILSYLILKNKKTLVKVLRLVIVFSIIFLIAFFYIEIILNKTYNNEETFANFYDTNLKDENVKEKEHLDTINSLLNGELKTKTDKEVFIEKSLSQFLYFRIKAYLIFIFYVIIILILTYLMSKIDRKIRYREMLEKDDKIIFKN